VVYGKAVAHSRDVEVQSEGNVGGQPEGKDILVVLDIVPETHGR
jgi:hypothetical protein